MQKTAANGWNYAKKKRRREEGVLQECAIVWLRKKGYLVHSIPNEGKRSLIENARLNRLGRARGVPDIFICEPRGKFSGLYIEFKANPKAKVDEMQIWWQEALKSRGYDAHIVRSYEEFLTVVGNYFNIPTKLSTDSGDKSS